MRRMTYLVIERFRGGDPVPVYRRFRDSGRLMPDGLRYAGSWVTEDLAVCYQVMECDDRRQLDEWMDNWRDLPALPNALLGPILQPIGERLILTTGSLDGWDAPQTATYQTDLAGYAGSGLAILAVGALVDAIELMPAMGVVAVCLVAGSLGLVLARRRVRPPPPAA